jgi:hypothetical protein
MADEFPPRDQESNATDGGDDPEAPVVPQPHESSAHKNQPGKYAERAGAYIQAADKAERAALIWQIKRVFGSANFWIAAATVSIAISTGIYTHYAGLQWIVMRKQFEQMNRQTGLMSKQLEVSSGAILRLTMFEVAENTYNAHMQLTNSGQATATDVHGLFTISLHSIPDNKVIGKPRTVSVSLPNIVGPPGPPESRPRNTHDWNQTIIRGGEIDAVIKAKAAIVVDFAFTYNNGFETIRDQGYCDAFMGFTAVTTVISPVQTQTTGGFENVECTDLPREMVSLQNRQAVARQQQQQQQQQSQKPN